MKTTKQSALITGATSGIGQEIAGLLVGDGCCARQLKPEVFSSRISPAAYTIDLKDPDA